MEPTKPMPKKNRAKAAAMRDNSGEFDNMFEGHGTRQPVVDFDTGHLFPGAMTAKVQHENDLRLQMTTFKGAQQLYLDEMNSIDSYANRQVLPYVWDVEPVGQWYAPPDGKYRPFRGYNNPEYRNLETDVVYSSHYGSIDNFNLQKALNGTTDFSKDWEKHVGAILQSDSGLGLESANPPIIVPTDNMGIHNPDAWKGLEEQYERDHQYARQVRLQYQDENRVLEHVENDPSMLYMEEQARFRAMRDNLYDQSGVATLS